MSDFVYPSFFEVFRKPGSIAFDFLKKVHRPFQILKGGYQIVIRNGKESQIFGSKAKEKRFRQEARLGHRSQYREFPGGRHVHGRDCRSRPRPGKVLRDFGRRRRPGA